MSSVVNTYDDWTVSVEGHTDNSPIGARLSESYPSNWELSVARAAAAVRFLTEKGVDSDRLAAVGYGDTRPVASNDTPTGRELNRRVELILETKQ